MRRRAPERDQLRSRAVRLREALARARRGPAREIAARVGAGLVDGAHEAAAGLDAERRAVPVDEPHVRTVAHELHEVVGRGPEARVVVARHPDGRLEVREAAGAALEAGRELVVHAIARSSSNCRTGPGPRAAASRSTQRSPIQMPACRALACATAGISCWSEACTGSAPTRGDAMITAICLFLVGACAGAFMVFRHLKKLRLPGWVAIAHGLAGASGFTVLLLFCLREPAVALARWALGILIGAIALGCVNVVYHLRGVRHRLVLIATHALVAVSGVGTLASAAIVHAQQPDIAPLPAVPEPPSRAAPVPIAQQAAPAPGQATGSAANGANAERKTGAAAAKP